MKLTAITPEESIRLAQEYDDGIQLLLTDVVMPGMNGRELSERVRTIYPDLKVLFMSGYTDNAQVNQDILDSGHVLIDKPFTPENLVVKVREVLDS